MRTPVDHPLAGQKTPSSVSSSATAPQASTSPSSFAGSLGLKGSTPAMSSGSGELSPYDRYRVLTTAQAMWAERERGFPKFTRQKWDDGTPLARAVALWAAAIKLGLIEEAA